MYELYVQSTDILIEPIRKLFNVILRSGVYPESWSRAIISPLLKKGSFVVFRCCFTLGKMLQKY